MNENLGQLPEIETPEGIMKELLSVSEALRRQSDASRAGNAVGGHPAPAFFYGRVSEICKAAAVYIKSTIPVPTPVVPPVAPVPPVVMTEPVATEVKDKPKAAEPAGKK